MAIKNPNNEGPLWVPMVVLSSPTPGAQMGGANNKRNYLQVEFGRRHSGCMVSIPESYVVVIEVVIRAVVAFDLQYPRTF